MNEIGYRHGAYVSELPTTMASMTPIDSPTVVFGTAPIHLAKKPADANIPVLCNSLTEFVEAFGWSDDFDRFTLCEAAKVHFQLYNIAPVIFVNVLDVNKHAKAGTLEIEGVSVPAKIDAPIVLSTLKISTGSKPVTASIVGVTNSDPITIPSTINAADFVLTAGDDELVLTTDYTVANGKVTLTEAGLAKVDGGLTFTSGANTYVELIADTDYTAAHDTDGNTVITVVATSKVVDDKINLACQMIDAAAVTTSDIIGGVDLTTGKNTGLELVEEIYPRFGVVAGTIIAPKFSENADVAAAMNAKCENINGCFQSLAVVDLSTEVLKNYSNVNAVKTNMNYTGTRMVTAWPKVALNGEQYHLGTQLAALMPKVDADHNGIPYKSPSNEDIRCDQSALKDGTDLFLGKSQANFLNGRGVVTALNFAGSWRMWGNRVSCYPGNSDPKDSFISTRRVFNWISNTLVTNYWSEVDEPINRTQVDSIITKANLWLSGLTSMGALLGGRVEFLEAENPEADLLAGIVRFHVYIAPPTPAREIDFVQEFDSSYLSTLFG